MALSPLSPSLARILGGGTAYSWSPPPVAPNLKKREKKKGRKEGRERKEERKKKRYEENGKSRMCDNRKIFGSDNYIVNIVQVLMQGAGGPPHHPRKGRKKEKMGWKEKEKRVMFVLIFCFAGSFKSQL